MFQFWLNDRNSKQQNQFWKKIVSNKIIFEKSSKQKIIFLYYSTALFYSHSTNKNNRSVALKQSRLMCLVTFHLILNMISHNRKHYSHFAYEDIESQVEWST